MLNAALLIGALTASCGDVEVDATSRAASATGGTTSVNQFSDAFDVLDRTIWTCEYSCPSVSSGVATFSLLPAVQPNNEGSWSKIRYTPRRFTSGTISVKFALTARPTQSVFWGVALWDDGPSADQSQYNEINFGYTTDGSFTNTQMDFVSARLGKKLSLKVEAGKDLYDGAFHTGKLVYDETRIELYLDDKLLETITDRNVIPTAPLNLTLGSRLVTTPVLTSRFDQMIDSCEIAW